MSWFNLSAKYIYLCDTLTSTTTQNPQVMHFMTAHTKGLYIAKWQHLHQRYAPSGTQKRSSDGTTLINSNSYSMAQHPNASKAYQKLIETNSPFAFTVRITRPAVSRQLFWSGSFLIFMPICCVGLRHVMGLMWLISLSRLLAYPTTALKHKWKLWNPLIFIQ